MATRTYNKQFFENLQYRSNHSAIACIDAILEFVHPKSVVDVGCGTGSWLREFYNKIPDINIMGIDGDYVPRNQLSIPQECFMSANLEEPLSLPQKFDLAVSLEVAEHLKASAADNFIATLTALSDVVLFSAAIPWQGGTLHINEQYPEYWAEKFARHGYVCADAIRAKIWHNQSILWPYRQNALFFVKASELCKYPLLQKAAQITDPSLLTRVHPNIYEYRSQLAEMIQSPWATLRYFAFRFRHRVFKKKKRVV